MSVIGNSLATLLLEVDSINRGTYDLFLEDCVGTQAALFKAGVTGTDLAEACDVQQADVKLRIRQFASGAAQSCKGVTLTGSSNANVSFSRFDLQIQHVNADALDVISGDNNEISLVATRAGGGTGRTALLRGSTASNPVGGDSNVFFKISGAGAVYAQGTSDPGVTTAVTNVIYALDTGNGTPAPTVGTGSRWVYQRLQYGTSWGFGFGPTAFTNLGDAQLNTQRTNISTETLRVHNSLGDNIRITDGTYDWSLGIDGDTGDLRIVRFAGSGGLNLGNGVGVKVPGYLTRNAPATKTADFSVADNENWYINNKSGSTCTVTLPTASSYTGREIMIQNYQAQTVISASSNVVPLGGGSAATAILAGTAGKWATLVSDGTNWVIMQAGG